MNLPSHIAYPYIIANTIAWLLGVKLTLKQNLLLMLFSVLPDVDLLIHWLQTRITNIKFNPGINHHLWPSHWPISYVPLVLIMIIWPSTTTILMVFGIYSHLVLDSIACAWGIMWFYPFSKHWYNYFALKFRGINDGFSWLKKWNQTGFHTAELISLALVIIHLIIF